MAFDAGSIEGRLTLDRSPFTDGLRLAKDQARDFEAKNITAKVDADTAEAEGNLIDLRNHLYYLKKDAHIKVNVDTAAATAQLEALKREEAGVRDKAAEAAGAQGMGGLLAAGVALGPALIPAIAGLTAGTLAFGSAIGAATVGLGGVALVALPAMSQVMDAQKKLTTLTQQYNLATTDKQRATVLAKERELWAGLSGPQQAALKALQDLKASYESWSQGLQPGVLAILPPLLAAAREGMTLLTPIVKAASTELHFLAQDLQLALGSPLWKRFADSIAGTTGQAISEFGHIIGNLAVGFAGLLEAFAPLAVKMGAGLVDLTAKFAAWGVHLGESSAFHKFIDYVQTEGPKLLHVLGDLVQTALDVGKALAPLSPVVLAIVDGVLKATDAVIKFDPHLVILAYSLYELNKVLGLTKSAFKAAKLALDDMSKTNAVMLALAALALAAYELYTHWDTVWTGIKTVTGNVVSWVVSFMKNHFVDPILTFFGMILHGAATMFGWVPGVGGKLKEAEKAFDSFRSSVDEKLSSIASDASTWGEKVSQAFALGVQSQAYLAPVAVGAMVDATRRAALNGLKIESPSKVFMAMGQNVALGLAAGIDSHSRFAVDATRQTMLDVIAAGSLRDLATASPVPTMLPPAGGDGSALPAASSSADLAQLIVEIRGLRSDIQRLPKDYQLGQRIR